MKNAGYRKLIVWQNTYKLRKRIYDIASKFPNIEIRRISQMRDAARSVKQNIQEGYGRSIGEYLRYLEISKGSLRELAGDVEDCKDDSLITEEEFKELDELIGKTDYLIIRLIQSLRKLQ